MHLDRRVPLDLKVPSAQLDQRVTREIQVRLAQPDLRARRVKSGPKAIPATLVLKGHREPKATRAIPGNKARPERTVCR